MTHEKPRKIFVTGATGWVGSSLIRQLMSHGIEVVAAVRSPARAAAQLGDSVELVDWSAGRQALARALAGTDAVVNLAGAPILGPRWSRRRRRELWQSRVELTRELVAAIADIEPESRPRALVSASAVGAYGDRGDEILRENSAPAADGFLAGLCRDWERAAQSASELGMRVAVLRIGVVLGEGGGALERLLPLFRTGLGGRLGHGRQWVPWIHLDDLLAILRTAIEDERIGGVFNAVAPSPVSNRELTRVLAEVAGKPARFAVPAAVLRIALGRASQILLHSQRVQPDRLLGLGFAFSHPTLAGALRAIAASAHSISMANSGTLPTSRYLAERGGRYQLCQTTLVHAPVDDVFSFFSRAENLALLTPPRLHFQIRSPQPIAMEAGTVIDYRIQLARLPMTWRTRIDLWVPGRQFVDVQLRGPYRSWWHEHRFIARGGQTLMIDRVIYSMPAGPLGWLVHRLFVRRQLRAIFAFRTAAIAQRFPASTATVAANQVLPAA